MILLIFSFIVLGLGNVFCQGVDLMYLCHDNLERRTQLAKELALGIFNINYFFVI